MRLAMIRRRAGAPMEFTRMASRWHAWRSPTLVAVLVGACERSPSPAEVIPAGAVRETTSGSPDASLVERGLPTAMVDSGDDGWPWSDGIPSERSCTEVEKERIMRPMFGAARSCVSARRKSVRVTVFVKPGGSLRHVVVEGDTDERDEDCIRSSFEQLNADCARSAGFVAEARLDSE